ncbi:MAG: tRNA (guanosine(46)-N7)-methyltransferase TrmB [Rickettsiaceae bacterium H1]|nr:tRNA (guanosine(46)-N7)-methyltransferase TrmB [Rickettsiaceae bacterium H1]
MVVDCCINKSKWLTSFGRRKGKNFKQSSLHSLEDYVVVSPKKGFHLEMGFGYGEHILYKAISNPNIQYVGCEVYLNGIGKLLSGIRDNSIENISIWHGDVRVFLEKLPKENIGKSYILFPDPWPKRRTNKRRLISNEFLSLLIDKMEKNSQIVIATDNLDYANRIEKVILSTNLNYSKDKPDCIGINTRYHQKSVTPINWFQCKV